MRRPYLCRDCDSRFYDFRFKARKMLTGEPELEEILKEYSEARMLTPALDTPAVESPTMETSTREAGNSQQDRTA